MMCKHCHNYDPRPIYATVANGIRNFLAKKSGEKELTRLAEELERQAGTSHVSNPPHITHNGAIKL